jgi:hypothetical protein
VGLVTPVLISLNILLAWFLFVNFEFGSLYIVFPNLILISIFYVRDVGRKPFTVKRSTTICLEWIEVGKKKRKRKMRYLKLFKIFLKVQVTLNSVSRYHVRAKQPFEYLN